MMQHVGNIRAFSLPAAVLLPASVVAAGLFAVYAPEPYMDEPFHVTQTQRYCAGRWREWDPKITTFPGLYLFGTALGRSVAAVQRFWGLHPTGPLCGTTLLRAVNLLFAAACLPLFFHAAKALDRGRTPRQLALLATACFLFPLHFFYAFLYYTDVPSLFFSLASHTAAVQRRYRLAALLAALAVLMRQTNAVWVAFSLGCAVLDRCSPQHVGSAGSSIGERPDSSAKAAAQTRSKQQPNSSTRMQQQGHSTLGLTAALAHVSRQAWTLRLQLAADLWPLAAVVVAFAAFVVVNGGIVVGDRANHSPVQHLAQPLYCLLYCTAWLAPAFWSPGALAENGSQLATAFRRQPAAATAAAAAAAALAVGAVSRGTLAHPFLLADNRHYTFYLWRRLLNRTCWARYALIFAYLYSAWALHVKLQHRGTLWLAGLTCALCLVLVPAHLLEPRYFSVPFYIAFLHMRTPSARCLAAVIALFAAVNAAAVYLFLFRPFSWPDGSVARFIW